MYSIDLAPRCFKWKMLSLSGPKALLFLHLLIALLTRSVVNVCAIFKVLFVSLVTNRVSLEEVCLPSFHVFNCWFNMAARCLDHDNKLPLKVISSVSASRFALPSIPLIVLHILVISSGPRSQQNIFFLFICVHRCGSVCHNSVLAVQARWGLFYGGHLVLSSYPISLLVQVPRGVCVVQ